MGDSGMSVVRHRTCWSHKKQRWSQSSSDFSPLRCALQTDMRVMERTFREQLFFLVLCLSVLKGDSRYIEVSERTYFSFVVTRFCKDSEKFLYNFLRTFLSRTTRSQKMNYIHFSTRSSREKYPRN